MGKTNIKIEGIEEMIKDLSKKGKSVNCVLRKHMIKTTNKCKRIAKEKVPKDTGTLRGSIHSEVVENGETFEGIVETNCEYAAYVEYGTGRTGAATNTNPEVDVSYRADWQGRKAQPYMYPAFIETRDSFLEELKKEIKTVIEK